jgi:DeoR family fructose operon transcriptional repressor
MSNKVELRHQSIISAIQSRIIDSEALSTHLGVSVVTLRRDLNRLQTAGRLVRTFGGAVPIGGHEPELTPTRRNYLHRSAKEAIGRTAAAMVHAGDTIIIDGGTTTAAFARQLRGRRNLRVITNSLQVAAAISEEQGIDVVLLGGSLRRVSLATSGSLAVMILQRVSADRVFVSADGIVAGRGLCEASIEQTQLKELMMAQGCEVVVLADGSKLGRAAQQAWAPLPLRWTLVTDAQADAKQVAAFRELPGVTVVLAEVQPSEMSSV